MQLDELFNPVITERVAPQNAFKAIFVMGPPGSGKNTIIDKHLSSPHFKVEDIDEVMARYKAVKREEASWEKGYDLTLKRRYLWQQNWLGLIINTTGRRAENVAELKKVLEDFGYDTFAIFVKAPYDVAYQRVMNRPFQATKVGDVGRKVDAPYFDKAYVDSVRNLRTYKTLFDPTRIAVVINDPNNQYYEASLTNLERSLSRFLRSPVRNPNGKEKLASVNQ